MQHRLVRASIFLSNVAAKRTLRQYNRVMGSVYLLRETQSEHDNVQSFTQVGLTKILRLNVETCISFTYYLAVSFADNDKSFAAFSCIPGP